MADLAKAVWVRLAALSPDAKRLVVAVSGGPDSVALLRLLSEGDYRLHVAHLDHALRPASAEDAAFVRGLAEALGLTFHTERVEVAGIAAARGWNLEDAARRLRYSYLTRVAKRVSADAVVTGHTRDDQAETVLMQLLRGAAYLKGVAAKRGRLLRPLLEVGRQDLLVYLEGLEQPYRTDASNADTGKTRAWLRHEILPALERRYPQLRVTLAKLAEAQRAQAEHFDAVTAPLLHSGSLNINELKGEDSAVQRHAIARLINLAGSAAGFDHVETVRAQLSRSDPVRLSLPKDRYANLAYGRLTVSEARARAKEPGEAPPGGLPAELDPGKVAAFPELVFRRRRPGDRIRLAGGGKKLKDLLIDLKVPREARDGLRLLASGSEVLWVEGLAADVRVAQAREDPDLPWMRLALEQAKEALARDEVPVGAVVVKDGEVIARGANAAERSHDPTAHAEMLALRRAARTLGDWRLRGCTLYVTLEPCTMCFGAMLQAQLPRLVYGARNRREGALGGVADLTSHRWKHSLDLRSGLLAKEAAALMTDFFREKRAQVPMEEPLEEPPKEA
ncbi:MAG: tRNA adenosine(34) deaminase TadA [Deinococcota bacterium]|nr:tRNA adenosine(34) deaminase TadA [Deinococcota bacterium]